MVKGCTNQTHLPNITFNIICIIRTFVFYRCTVVAQMVSLLKALMRQTRFIR